MATLQEILFQGLDKIETVLLACTGLTKLEARSIAAWGFGTYGLPNQDLSRYPILLVYGFTDTGKSITLLVLKRFCYEVVTISAGPTRLSAYLMGSSGLR